MLSELHGEETFLMNVSAKLHSFHTEHVCKTLVKVSESSSSKYSKSQLLLYWFMVQLYGVLYFILWLFGKSGDPGCLSVQQTVSSQGWVIF